MPLSHWPPVSVVMPVLNEERHLEEAVGRVLDQDYPGELEVVLAIGPSKDRTQEIADKLADRDPRISIVPNPTGKTPAALNVGIAHAKHDILVRVDGHGALTDGYITRAVEVLDESGADNVGGVMAAEGRTPTEMAVACAYRSRLGSGCVDVPPGRQGRAGRHRLSGRVPAGRARAGRRLRRDHAPGPGLGAELPDPQDRRPDLVHPGPVRHLPAAVIAVRGGEAVLPHRPVAPRGDPPAPRDREQALPGAADRGDPAGQSARSSASSA